MADGPAIATAPTPAAALFEAHMQAELNADLDATMAALSENAMSYGAASKVAGKKLAILRYAATDGSSG